MNKSIEILGMVLLVAIIVMGYIVLNAIEEKEINQETFCQTIGWQYHRDAREPRHFECCKITDNRGSIECQVLPDIQAKLG